MPTPEIINFSVKKANQATEYLRMLIMTDFPRKMRLVFLSNSLGTN